VQGVGFRYFTQREAAALGLAGWVRNNWDGSVEVIAEGDRRSLDRLLTLLRQGPSSASVSTVSVDWQPPTGEFSSFAVSF
jgi:acylphosphatase